MTFPHRNFASSSHLPPLPVMSQRPSRETVDREMAEHPGLGRLQAYRQVQMRMAFKALCRSDEGRRYFAQREARRHLGSQEVQLTALDISEGMRGH